MSLGKGKSHASRSAPAPAHSDWQDVGRADRSGQPGTETVISTGFDRCLAPRWLPVPARAGPVPCALVMEVTWMSPAVHPSRPVAGVT